MGASRGWARRNDAETGPHQGRPPRRDCELVLSLSRPASLDFMGPSDAGETV